MANIISLLFGYTDGKFKALIIEMCLKSSSYATMALREVLKKDTSVETQAALSASHEDVSNKSVMDESRDADAGKDNVREDCTELCDESADMGKQNRWDECLDETKNIK